MVYAIWLFGISALFLALERVWPRKKQRLFRAGFLQDVGYLVFNSEYLGVLIGVVAIRLTKLSDPLFAVRWMDGQPLGLQLLVLLVVFDFLQWLIHNLLHRVSWLWEFHKLHHSIEDMDWLGNWRFHGMESVVYRSLLYVPAALFGFSGAAMFWYGVINTVAGHFAHSNTSLRLGPLRYLINSPEMHRWHHAHPEAGPPDRNFGIALSVWDWLFGTAHLPNGQEPERYGFAGIETYPRSLVGRLAAPFFRRT